METIRIEARGCRPSERFRHVSDRIRALKIILLPLHAIFLWVLYMCRFKYVSMAPSPVFKSIEIDGEGQESSTASTEGSRRRLKARVLWERSSLRDAARRRLLAHKLRQLKSIDETISSWQTYLFLNSRKQTLFAQSWIPAVGKRTKGLLVLLHGLNEHSGRYLHFAMQLNCQGYGVYAMDWIGHGGSDELHGYVPSLEQVVTDTKGFVRWVVERNPGLPCFLFGHSTGGAIALKAACHPLMEPLLKGIVLTSPALRVQPAHPVLQMIAPVFSMLLPTLQLEAANKRGLPVSRDPAQLVAKYTDPLVYTRPLRIRTGCEVLRMTMHLQRNMEKLTVPFLVMHGTDDKVTDPAASQDLYHRAASKQKDLKLYDGYLHDLLFEPEREDITQDIIHWMDKTLTQS